MRSADFLGVILGLLFPVRCAACGEVLATSAQQAVLCHACEAKLRRLEFAPKHGAELDGLFSAFIYSGAGAALIKEFKFNRNTACYKNALQKPFEEYVKNASNNICIDIVVPVPMYAAAKRKRGFNQSDYIAKCLAAYLCLPYGENILQKVQKNKVQHHLPSAERYINVKGVYACKEPQKVCGKTILLVDDIVTTGATMAECAKVLRSAGAEMVYGAAVLATLKK